MTKHFYASQQIHSFVFYKIHPKILNLARFTPIHEYVLILGDVFRGGGTDGPRKNWENQLANKREKNIHFVYFCCPVHPIRQ